MPPNRVTQIVNGKRAITANTALRLGAYFGISPELWLNLQVNYEMRVAWRSHGEDIRKRVRPRAA